MMGTIRNKHWKCHNILAISCILSAYLTPLSSLHTVNHGDILPFHSQSSPKTADDDTINRKHEADVTEKNDSFCTIKVDHTYGGLILDCSHRNLKQFFSYLIPDGTTTILLNNNGLETLQNDIFAKATGLRYLDLSKNLMTSLQPDWFRGIKTLHVFRANQNQIKLDAKSFTKSVFRLFPSLKTLDLGNNLNINLEGKYPDYLLEGLHILEELILDTFAVELNFGSIFDNVTTLKTLTLTGGVRLIRKSSFQSFYHIPLETLKFQQLYLLRHTQTNAFLPLRYLKNLFMNNVRQEVNETLLSLQPFVGRHFYNLHFYKIGSAFRQMSSFEGSKVITIVNGKYIRDICVENLSFLSSGLLSISHDVFASTIFGKCLKSFNTKDNPLWGEVNTFFELAHFQNLKRLTLSTRNINPKTVPKCLKTTMSFSLNPRSESSLTSHTFPSSAKYAIGKFNTPNIFSDKIGDGKHEIHIFQNSNSINCSKLLASMLADGDVMIGSNARCYGISRSLEYIFISETSSGLLSLEYTVGFWPNNLKELYIAHNGIHNMTGQVVGLNRLELLDFSENDAKQMQPYFFDHYPSLKILIMQSVHLDSSFIAESSSRLFSKLTVLETLDLTGNGLNLFSSDTFKRNKLNVLILARNRFKSIPFELEDTPDLCLLDLSYNSISALSRDEMTKLDRQTDHPNGCFSLRLEGNILSCSCSQFRFVFWLQKTHLQLDLGGNYPCISEEGTLSNTSEYRDLEAFWRQCRGQTALLVSITILALMLFAFTIAILLYHFKSRLEGYIHQVILRKVKPKTPSDYAIGVCLKYSDQDATFTCIPLRSFIERELCLTTFVRHRDLLANQYRDVAISHAIGRSWRVLFVVTKSYLCSDRWSFYAMKLASAYVSSTNQGKIVLLVEEGLEKKVPMCLLKAAREGSVITLGSGVHELNTRVKEQLTRALKSDYNGL